jgi:hypothetical protein
MRCCFENQGWTAVNLDSAARADSLAERVTLITACGSMCERDMDSYRSLHSSKAKVSSVAAVVANSQRKPRSTSRPARDFRLSARAHSSRWTTVVELCQ